MLLTQLCQSGSRHSLNIGSLTARLSCHQSVVTTGHRSMSDNTGQSKGLVDRIFGLESNTASPSTNRWTMFVPAFCTHVCLGAPYGWSAISAQLTRENGLVTSAASDWALDLASYPMSVMIAAGGISAALMGKWTIKVTKSFTQI